MPIVKIPQSQKPTFKVSVNGEEYEYPSGQEVEVPESVASVIQNIVDNQPKAEEIVKPQPQEPKIEELTVTENGYYEAPSGVDGYNPVNVWVEIGEIPSGIENGVEITELEDGWPRAIKVYGQGWETITSNGMLFRTVEFAENVTEIPPDAFNENLELYNLTEIPAHVSVIGNGAFRRCPMHSMTFLADNIQLGSDVFQECNNLFTVYIAGAYDSLYIEPTAFRYSFITDVYVPWTEEEAGVGGEELWGVENIHYGYVHEH